MQLRVTKVASVTSCTLPFGPPVGLTTGAPGHDETPADPVGTGAAGVCVDVTRTSG